MKIKTNTMNNKEAALSGTQLIAEERQEQIEKHGYYASHDAQHTDKQLIKQAAMLLIDYIDSKDIFALGELKHIQDWNLRNQTMDSPVHRLKVAGALIAAEIDRIQNKHNEQ